jgi:hypothetical protein
MNVDSHKLNDHLETGMEIKKLVDDGKIRLDKFDKNFTLEVVHL